MPSSLLPLIRHWSQSITTAHYADPVRDFTGLAACELLAENGVCDEGALNTYMDTLRAMGEAPPLNAALTCGTTSNAMCALFMGAGRRLQLANVCAGLAALRLVVADHKHKLIRIEIGSHAYVIEQVDTRGNPAGGPRGNIYQSNVAVYGVPDRGCTFEDFLANTNNPVDLTAHIDDVEEIGTARNQGRRWALYQALYVTAGFLQRNNRDTIMMAFYRAHSDGILDRRPALPGQLQVHRITWSPILWADERLAASTIRDMLAYHPASRAAADRIWQGLA